MALFKIQDGVTRGYYLPSFRDEVSVSSSGFWDPTNARFTPEALPYVSAIPAVVAALILLGYIFKLLPKGVLTPRWTEPFVEEPKEIMDDLTSKEKPSFGRLTLALFVVSVVGLGLQTLTVFYPTFRSLMVYPAASWGVACLLIAICRPVTTPKSLLILYCTIAATQLIVLVDGTIRLSEKDVPTILAILTSMVSIAIILIMPIRHPSRPSTSISAPFSEPTSSLRSPEDNMTLLQFMTVSWMKPLIEVGNKRQLNDDDVWGLGYEFKHRMLHDGFRELKGSVLRRLLEANGIDLVIMSVLAIIELAANFSVPVLLQKILQSMENPLAPRRAALNYAVLSLVVRLIVAQSSVFTLWFGRRAYERSRGEMITMLYEKTLSRKVVSLSSKPVAEANGEGLANGNGNGNFKHEDSSRLGKVRNCLMMPFRWLSVKSKSKKAKKKDTASMGKIMNLMRFDAYEVAQRFWEFSSIVSQPLALIFSVVLIWRLLGWPCLIGIITVFFAQAVNALLARALLYWERERRVATDTKLHKISQLVDAIRHLRYYGWQDVWLTRIMESRQHELKLRIITSIWRILISFTNTFASGMFPVVAFWAYTVLAGQPLRVDIAFPALQLFSMLETSLRDLPNLITVLLNAKVSVGRLEEFMREPDKEETDFTPSSKIEMKHASFAWPGSKEPVLRDINLSFEPGLNVICGEVGAGKTALLQALLGELDQLDGEYHRTNEMVGYCGQTPWLQSMSIRENILFSAPYEEARYRQVLEACALIPDMANFKHGDLSMVGENGVGLSGGQKARVSLARAIYSKANILLLDDPLSALDHQTADYIVRRCIAGPLVRDRTTILVTHRTELCLGMAQQAVQIDNGRATLLDPDTIPFEELHRMKSSDSANEDGGEEKQVETSAPDKFIEEEFRAHGGVQASVYWEYIKAGKLKWWFVLIVALALYRLIEVGETWFLKQWGEAYGSEVKEQSSGPFDDLPSPEVDIRPWLIGFFLLAAAQSIAFLVSQGFMLVIIYKAGKELFERVMTMVTHATFRFYDITPVGRLMNRLTSDINTVDGNISNQFQNVAMLSIAWISSIVVIGSVTSLFLVFAIGLTIGFVIIFLHFLPTSQSLRRLEMVSLTPLISNFGALTDGLTTIRAYCASSRFQDRVIAVTDNFQKMDHFYWSLQAWLMYRFDTLSATSTFILTVLALYTGVSAGLTAFVLTASSKFVNSTHALCKQYGQLQMDFVSVERVVELLHLEQEAPGKVEPPAYWPLYGSDIVFENVTIRYAPHLDPALTDVSLTIKGGSTTALIGRTGSGKSTLALSLLATTLPTSGRILIDGIDISTVNLQALRKRVTFLAQEPVLFPGTMRQNLDPLEEYSDVECSSVLSKIAARHEWSLDTHIDTGGKNLSQGQRQLVGLARALLRRSPIVVMDEATASIDRETAGRIQELLRSEMKESTVITIAHRVEAVRGAEYCVVLGKGRIEEVGRASEMKGRME
ncbi:ABC transporter-like protein [Mollisia scopiformis]|uniref:ABC transporter-like protein n=1 Tax=Mollisia scopiformis TaxID=149040 RepID=A0A194XKY9_MOLSC|nr:ABC transporter-like protein [Mollisia scopiformis]KUJ20900.1 ABC transporter-like protein [Mollisia scopiformis]